MKSQKFVVCISNSGYETSLELKKIYEVIEDSVVAAHSHVRVIDKSGEDYLFPAEFFAGIDLSPSLQAQIANVA